MVTQTFDSGVPGQPVLVGQNGVYAIPEGTPYYDGGKHGGAGVIAGSPTNTGDIRFRISLGMTGDHNGSLYLRNNTAHGSSTSSVNFFHLNKADNALIVQMRAAPQNALSIRIDNVEVRAGDPNDIPVGHWIRLDWRVIGTTFEWRLYHNSEGITPSLSGSHPITVTPADHIMLGVVSSALIPKNWSFDTFRTGPSNEWAQPYDPQPDPEYPTTIWDGTAEVPVGSVAVWDGSNEIPATMEAA